MKNWGRMLILLGFLGLSTGMLQGQQKRWQLQAGVGLTATANKDLNWHRLGCREGCPIIDQRAVPTAGGWLGISRTLAPRHALYAATGYSAITFYEDRDFWPGNLVTQKQECTFLQAQLGYHFYLHSWGTRSLLMSHGLLAERSLRDKDGYLQKNHLSYLGKLGFNTRLGARHSLTINAVFRTAITEYQQSPQGSASFDLGDFRPIGGGLELVFSTDL